MLSDYTLDPQRLVHVGTFQFDDPNAPELTPRALRRRQRALFPDDVGTAHEDSDDDADEDRDDSTTLPYLPRRRRGPKKILLSPNKQLLLINGTFFNERSSLVVYFLIRFSLSAFRFQFSFFLSFPVFLFSFHFLFFSFIFHFLFFFSLPNFTSFHSCLHLLYQHCSLQEFRHCWIPFQANTLP